MYYYKYFDPSYYNIYNVIKNKQFELSGAAYYKSLIEMKVYSNDFQEITEEDFIKNKILYEKTLLLK